MNYTHEVENMCVVKKGPHHGPAPIPEEGKWIKPYEIKDEKGVNHEVTLKKHSWNMLRYKY